jgi:polysaccharide chain length determinant protein (PEP-CTERM system associated)
VLPGKKYTLDEMLRIVRRRWWLVLLPLVVGVTAGVLTYQRLPVKYRSETMIMVVPQRIPDNYVKPTVTTDVADRLRSISNQILSRSRLERIIQDFGLYKDLRAGTIMEDIVDRMRSDIEVRLEGPQGRESSFRVTYKSGDAKVAQKVTERLASLFIEENLRDRETLADSTNQFLESQLQDAKQRLIEQEKKLEEYRRRFSGQLPSQVSANLQSIQAAQMQLQSLSETMNRARERRLLVERQIADAQTLPADIVAPNVPASPDATPVLPLPQRLEAARARLEVYKRRYTPDHPDVLALERQVRDLQAQIDEEADRSKSDKDKPVSRAELVRQKRVGDLQAELGVIDRQLAAAQTEEGRLKNLIGSYQAKVEVVPTRESELVELTRDYATLQETYSNLLQKREDSKLAANLERRQIGEQFRVLDPASLPERPYNQKQRLGALIGGPLGGLALGLLLVAFLEYRDSTFKCEEDVVRVLSLPVLALVPLIASEAEDSRQQAKSRALLSFNPSTKSQS